MQKEVLTKEIIKNELTKHFTKVLRNFLLLLPVYILGCMLMVFALGMLVNVFASDKMIANVIEVIISIILGIVYILEVFNSLKNFLKIKKGEFELVNDWVVDKLPKRRGGKYQHYRPNTLIFARNKKYGIPEGLNYEWSQLYSMSDDGVYRCAEINDDFYVIIVGKKKNVLAYNKKMFELKN